jgi:hypothetical protein
MRTFSSLFAALLLGLLPASPAHAKSSSWWDCFFREFELCQGRSDPDAPDTAGEKGSGKAFCDGKARVSCDEEERANTMRLSGHSSNEKRGKATAPESHASATPSKPGDELSVPASVVVEGSAPSGDKTVLGIDVTQSIAEVARGYPGRNVRGCRPIDDAYTRVLCLDAPGAGGGAPVELEFYRGRLVSLNYEAEQAKAVKFRPALAVAEEKTGTKAALSSSIQDPTKPYPAEIASRYCLARFPLAGGTLTLYGLPAGEKDSAADACQPSAVDGGTLTRVEWAPPSSVQREVAGQRKADAKPTLQQRKRDELEKTRALLPL